MDKLTKYTSAVALQVLIIFSVIIFKLVVLTGGTDIALRIEPVDPTSPLRGDYATFRYSSISDVYSYTIESQSIKNGDTVYVLLRKTTSYYMADEVRKTKPADDSQIFLKGRVAGGGLDRQPDFKTAPYRVDSRLRVVYGIEEYFIPEGKGRNFTFAGKEAAAIVSVNKDGDAVLKSILVDGNPWP